MTLRSASNTQTTGLPEGEDLQRHVTGRHRRGNLWLGVFVLSLLVAILILSALIFNIVNQSFGLVAKENAVEEGQLLSRFVEQQMASAPNTTTSEDDEALATAIAADPNAIGFFGFAYYQQQAPSLRAVAVNGVTPSFESAAAGDYELARPLYLYSSYAIMRDNPAVAAFIDYYLAHVNEEIDDVGYFPASQDQLDVQLNTLRTDMSSQQSAGAAGTVAVVGSSTVYPLSLRMAERFLAAGFTGDISVESMGTTAGFASFCVDKQADIANASRAITRQEAAACNKARRAPAEYLIGADALAVVVSSANTFLTEATTEQLQQIFTTAQRWSDVDPSWPDAPIVRYIPSLDSGTLDFFVERVFLDQLALADLPKQALEGMLIAGITRGRVRALESQRPFAERSQADILQLVLDEVVKPKVVASWNLLPSVFNRAEIEAEAFEKYPDAELEFYAWLNRSFLTSSQSSMPEQAGVRTAILGSLWVILITVLFAVPVGIGSAIYLEEYATHGRINRILQTNIDNLSGVPSIIYGILGLAIFVRFLESFTSGKALGIADPTTANGRTILSAGLTLGLLVLPVVIINAQEALRAVPNALREAGYGMGGTKWQVVRSHVLANALPGIFTGTILAMSRAVGETAPLIVIGASTFITVDPNGVFSKFTVLPMQIYQWTTRPQAEFQHIAAAASIVLLIMLFMLNATAIYLRNRFAKQL